jgi:hypothetical protein
MLRIQPSPAAREGWMRMFDLPGVRERLIGSLSYMLVKVDQAGGQLCVQAHAQVDGTYAERPHWL